MALFSARQELLPNTAGALLGRGFAIGQNWLEPRHKGLGVFGLRLDHVVNSQTNSSNFPPLLTGIR